MSWIENSGEPAEPSIGWLIQRHDDVPQGDVWLTAGEKKKLEQLRFVKRRADWRLGRWTAKRAVCAFPGAPAGIRESDVEVLPDADSVPRVSVRGEGGLVTVSISHSGGIGLCAVAPAGTAVGCDVEVVESRRESFVADYFTEGEREFVSGLQEKDRPLFVTLIWSAKESTLKMIEKGLSRDTRSVSVTASTAAAAGGWARLDVRCEDPDDRFRGWWRTDGTKVYTIVADRDPLDGVPRRLS